MLMTLIILGLGFDLVGAFLLSVKVVWSDASGRRMCAFFEEKLLKNWFEPVRGLDGIVHFVIDFTTWIPFKVFALLLKFLRWANENNYENECGIIGLIFLSIGFILQAIVNLSYS